MLIALALSLLIVLTLLRHLLEPACPGCAAKRWRDGPARLACVECGWSSGPDVGGEMPTPSYAAAQYEISFR